MLLAQPSESLASHGCIPEAVIIRPLQSWVGVHAIFTPAITLAAPSCLPNDHAGSARTPTARVSAFRSNVHVSRLTEHSSLGRKD
jgi:hypothetical protein